MGTGCESLIGDFIAVYETFQLLGLVMTTDTL